MSERDFSSVIKYENVKRIYPNKQLDCFLQCLTPGMAPNRGIGAGALLPTNANIVQIVVEICNSSVSDLNLVGVFFMWLLMSIAMMSPTIIPTLKTYEDILESGGKRKIVFGGLLQVFQSYGQFFRFQCRLYKYFLGIYTC